jgi:undecaprenyl-diphosphatase
MSFLELLKAILIGIVEGITEWLPISSTGHMILVDEFVKLNVSPEFLELFLVVIQLGAIMAVPVLFWNKLNPFSKKKSEAERKSTWSLLFKVVVGVLPAAVIGFLFDDLLDKYLYNYIVVAIALIVYGVIFIFIEKMQSGKRYRIEDVNDLTYKDALIIGAFQMLSLIPGTSRSGSTIIGGMLTGVSRVASAEFSFFMAIPIMLGASLLKIVKFVMAGFSATGTEIAILLVGMFVSFIVSLFSIKFLMDFVKRHSFSPFGVYRIILGIVVIGYFLVKII